jgi:hypothetical protein
MHEISRHTIHISEVLLVTIQNFESLREQQRYIHNESLQSDKGKMLLGKEYRERALEYLNFQIQMLKSLRERSISNHSRLSSEIVVVGSCPLFECIGRRVPTDRYRHITALLSKTIEL